ncbi:MAG: glycosyl transferase family 2, partial [Spirochaetes bacterium]|nr:glycosyl transferase family 2 [Spirochaetota bacterium]
LEDMYLAKQLYNSGMKIGYVASAAVHHIHNETLSKIKYRYARESVALQKIMPEIHISFFDFLRYFFNAIIYDIFEALKQKKLVKNIGKIIFLD